MLSNSKIDELNNSFRYYEITTSTTINEANLHLNINVRTNRYIKDTGAFTRQGHIYSYGWGFVLFSSSTNFSAILTDDDHKILIYAYVFNGNTNETLYSSANIVYIIE